jgi:hypothetical protein
MYGAGTELYEYAEQLAEDKFEESLQTEERTFGSKATKSYAAYIAKQADTKRKTKTLGKKA